MRRLAAALALVVLSVAATAAADPLKHFSDRGIAFDYPAAWQTYETSYRGLHWVPLVYVGSQALREPCIATSNSLSCSWPVDALQDNSVVGEWTGVYLPQVPAAKKKRRRLPRHNTVTIDGTRVRFFRSYPGCSDIGGDELITLAVRKSGFMQFAACLRGPDLHPLERQLFAMLRSTMFDTHAVHNGRFRSRSSP